MKYILLLITALTLLPVHAAAQSLGLHVGAARTSISMDDEGAGIGGRTGLIGGVSFDLPISDIAGLRLGAAYVEKGASFKGLDGGNLSLNYIELPAMMRYGRSVYGLVGATVGINSACSFAFPDLGLGLELSVDCSDPEDSDFEFETIDFGISAGIGFSVRASDSISLTLEVLHNRGLSDVTPDDGGKNRAFTAMAGIAVDFGG